MVVSDNFQNPADVVFVVEGTANLGGYIDTLLKHYIIPSLEVFNGGPPDPTDYGHDYSCTLYHLVTFFAADISPDTASRCSTLTTNINEFITWLENIPFIGGGGETCSHIAEGLSTALHVFDDIQERRKNTGGAAHRHCILVCNSPPYQLPSQEGVRYVGFTADQLANMMAQRGINLSIISPRKIAALQKLYEEANPPGENGMNIKDFTTDPRHHVLLHGYQLEERSHSPGTDSYTTDKQQLDQKPAHSPSFAIPGSRSFSPAPMPSFGDSQGPGGEFKVPSAAPTASTSSLLNTQQPSPHSQSQPSPQQIQRQQDNQLQQQSQLLQQQNQLQQNQLVQQQQNQMQQQQNQLQQQQQQQQQNQLQAGQQQMMQQQLLKQQQQQQQQSQASMVNPPMSQGMQNPSNNLQASMANQTPVSLQPSLASQSPLNMPRQTLHPRQFSDPVPTKADQLQNMGPRMTHTNIMTPAQTSQMNIMTSQAKLQQSNAMPGMTQSSAMPGLSQSNQMPGMTQPNTVPGMSQSNTMPGMSQSNQMPGMSQSNQMPGLAQSNQMPGMSQPNQVPGMTQANQMPGMSQPNQMPGMSQSNQMPGMTQSNPMSNIQNMPVSSGVGVLNPTGQQQTFAPQNVTNDPALGQQGQGFQGPPAQMRDRKIIWAGMLEWQEKMKAGSPQIPKVSRQLQCHLSIGPNDPEINASNWPKDLMMQLIPQSLLNSTQLQPLFKNSRQVAFHFGNHNLDSLKNLYRVMGTGFAGCVHFPNSAQCEVRVLLLLFSNKRKAFIGLIPNDQTAFVNGIRNVIFTHKRMQQNKMANNMMQSQQPQQPNVQFPGQQGGMVTQGMVTQGMSNIQMQQQPQNTMQTPIMSTQQGNLAIQQKMQQAQLAKQQEQVNQQKLLAQQRLQSQQQQQQRLHLHQQQQQLNQQNLNPQNLTQLLMQQQQVPQIRQPQMMMSQQRGPGTMPPQGQQGVMSGNIPNTMQQMTQPGPSSGPAGGQTGYDDLNLDFI